jgi:hypothetical protein
MMNVLIDAKLHFAYSLQSLVPASFQFGLPPDDFPDPPYRIVSGHDPRNIVLLPDVVARLVRLRLVSGELLRGSPISLLIALRKWAESHFRDATPCQ